FCPEVGVVVHSDGTLSKRDEAIVRHHVRGCKVISAAEADARAEAVLDHGSRLYECRRWDASWRRVIDTHLWCATPKRIIMDSDILTLHPPEEVQTWINSGAGSFMLGQPPPSLEMPPPVNGHKHIQTIFRENVVSL